MTNVAMHEVELVPIGKLHGAEYNPREMADREMEKLMASLAEFGFVQPVVARREDGLIVGGHQRVEAMRRLLANQKTADPEAVEVPVVWLDDVDDNRAKMLNLALNRISGEWDYDLLAELLKGLGEVPDLDLAITGFGPAELDDILSVMANTMPEPPPPVDPDEELRKDARKFKFEVETDEEAALIRSVLEAHGMTSPANAVAAFLAIIKAVQGGQ